MRTLFSTLKKRFSVETLKSNLTVDDEDLLVSRGKGYVVDRISSLLPYGYELEPGLFTIMDEKHMAVESIGYTLEVTPQTGATPEMASQLTSLFSSDLPTGTGIQVTLFADEIRDTVGQKLDVLGFKTASRDLGEQMAFGFLLEFLQ